MRVLCERIERVLDGVPGETAPEKADRVQQLYVHCYLLLCVIICLQDTGRGRSGSAIGARSSTGTG